MKGFTLLELAVASALTVVLAGATAALLIRGVTAAQRAEAALQQTFLLERAAEKMGRELRNAVPVEERRFVGNPEGVSFVVSEGPTTLTSVRYRLVSSENGASLVKEWQPFPEGRQPPQATTLATRLVNFSVLYGIVQREAGQRRLAWSQAWLVPPTESAALPRLVQVRLESQDSRGRLYSLTREFLIPQGIIKESSG